MERRSELGQLMHEEHFRTLVLICELENRVTPKAAKRPFDARNPEDRQLFEQLLAGLGEIGSHNAFEENVLFPLIRDKDEGQLTALLTSEHAQMAPMVQRLYAVTREILEQGTTAPRWEAFCSAARALVAEMMFHLEKEELTVVQQLGSYLEPGLDHALALRYETEAHRLTRAGHQADQAA
jgi:hemerythrin-like domain-containing protein